MMVVEPMFAPTAALQPDRAGRDELPRPPLGVGLGTGVTDDAAVPASPAEAAGDAGPTPGKGPSMPVDEASAWLGRLSVPEPTWARPRSGLRVRRSRVPAVHQWGPRWVRASGRGSGR